MIENNTKLTQQVVYNNILIFEPKTVDEAVVIQRKLIALGCAWADVPSDQRKNPLELGKCVSKGMVVKNGWMYTNPNPQSREQGLHCTVDQLDENYTPPLSAKEQSKLMTEFSAMAERLAAVEEQLARLSPPATTPISLSGMILEF